MLFDSWSEVGRVVLTGVVIYAYLVVVLRVSGKRTLASLNAFDLVVTVALGSVLATVVVSRDVSWSEAMAALAVLVLGQFVVALCSTRASWVRKVVKSEPSVLLCHGKVDADALANSRVTVGEIRQVTRAAGYGGLDRIAAVVLETDGTLSVIPSARLGDASALAELNFRPPRMPRSRGDSER